MRGYLFGILSAVFWALSGLLYNELPLSEYDALGKIISLLFLIDFCSLLVCLFIKHSLFNDLLCGTAFISLSCFRCVNVLLDSKRKNL